MVGPDKGACLHASPRRLILTLCFRRRGRSPIRTSGFNSSQDCKAEAQWFVNPAMLTYLQLPLASTDELLCSSAEYAADSAAKAL